jgi:hypothetical protein
LCRRAAGCCRIAKRGARPLKVVNKTYEREAEAVRQKAASVLTWIANLNSNAVFNCEDGLLIPAFTPPLHSFRIASGLAQDAAHDFSCKKTSGKDAAKARISRKENAYDSSVSAISFTQHRLELKISR